jgi:hypothetical protein
MLQALFSRHALARLVLACLGSSAVTMLTAGVCRAQELPAAPEAPSLAVESPSVRVSGSLTVSADFYEHTATPDSAQAGRRPAQLYRVLFTPTIELGGGVSLPINLNFLTPETNTLTPRVPSPSLGQILQNPANALGLSSISPKLPWAELHLGSHQPTYSELTAGDQPLFGAGFDLTPGHFRISASAGTTQRAVEPDSALNTPGAYRRDQYMARIGYGREGESSISLNAVFARDDASSLHDDVVSVAPMHAIAGDTSVVVPADTVRLRAAEGVVASLSAKAVIVDGIELTGEAALSSYTSDRSAAVVDIPGNPLKSLFTTRASTRADVGANAALSVALDSWGVKISGLYLGAGFVPIGYAFGQADRFEVAVAPWLNLFDRALMLKGSIGERMNNLSDNAGETATHVIGSASVDATIGEALTISARYSNYGVHNDQVGDTLKIRNVSQSLSIDPTVTMHLGGVSHSLTTSLALDAYDDYNVVTGARSSNDTRSAMLSYNASVDSVPLTLGVIASYLENRLFEGDLIVRSLGLDASYALFERAIEPRASIVVGSSSLGGGPSDRQLFLKLGLRVRAGEHLSVGIDVGSNRFTYADARPRGSEFRESLAQLSLSTSF